MIYIALFVIAALLLLLWAPKKGAVGLGLGVLVVIVLAAIVYWADLQDQSSLDKVLVTLNLDKASCGEESQLAYTIINEGDETVYRVYFRYSIYREGFSSPVSKSYSNDVTADRILEAGASYRNCIKLPLIVDGIDDSELLFKVEHKRAWFRNPIH